MGRKCAVPHCYTGYRKCKDKATLYRVPDDDFFLNKWQEAIAREDRPITPKDSVCEKHFRDEDIIRRRTIKDTVEMYQRPRLKPDAVPSIFPELPKFILKMVKKRRKMPIEAQQNSSYNTSSETVQSHSAEQPEIKQEPYENDFESIQTMPNAILNNEIEIKTDEHDDAEYFQPETIICDEDGKRIFCCSECDYKTRYPHNLRTHKTKHLSGEAAYMYCEHCPDFKTKWEITYKNHLKKKHGIYKKEVYRCTHCSFQTQAKMYFIRHYKIHSKKKSKEIFKCPECKFETHFQSSLNSHILQHKREHQTELPKEQKSFKCTECLYETNSKTHMIKHIKSAHNNRDDTVVTVNKYKTGSEYNEKQNDVRNPYSRHIHDTIVPINKCQTVLDYNESNKQMRSPHNTVDDTFVTVNRVETVFECNENQNNVKSTYNTGDDIDAPDNTIETGSECQEMQIHIEDAHNTSNDTFTDNTVETVSECIEKQQFVETTHTTDHTVVPVNIVKTVSECNIIQKHIESENNTSDDTTETVSECNETQTHMKCADDTGDNPVPIMIVETVSECNEKETAAGTAVTTDKVKVVSEPSTKQRDIVLSKNAGKSVYKCSKCPYRAHNSMLMEKHQEKHIQTAAKNQSASEVWKCQNCNYVTFVQDALLNHQQLECEKSFKNIHLEEESREESISKFHFDEVYIKQEIETEDAILEK